MIFLINLIISDDENHIDLELRTFSASVKVPETLYVSALAFN